MSWRVGGLRGAGALRWRRSWGSAGQLRGLPSSWAGDGACRCSAGVPHAWSMASTVGRRPTLPLPRWRAGAAARHHPPPGARRRASRDARPGWSSCWSTCSRAFLWMRTGATRRSTATRCCCRCKPRREALRPGHLQGVPARAARQYRRARVPARHGGSASPPFSRWSLLARRAVRDARVTLFRRRHCHFFREHHRERKKAEQERRQAARAASTPAPGGRGAGAAAGAGAAGGPREARPVREAGGGGPAGGGRGARDQQPAVLRHGQHPLRAGASSRR